MPNKKIAFVKIGDLVRIKGHVDPLWQVVGFIGDGHIDLKKINVGLTRASVHVKNLFLDNDRDAILF